MLIISPLLMGLVFLLLAKTERSLRLFKAVNYFFGVAGDFRFWFKYVAPLFEPSPAFEPPA